MQPWRMRGFWLSVVLCSCGTDDAPSRAGSSGAVGTTVATTSSTSGADGRDTTAQTTVVTFGMDGPGSSEDEGDDIGFVPPLDIACASGGTTLAHCALCDVREQNCLDNFKCVAWAEDGGEVWTGTRCIGTALQPAAVGEPCTITGDLASGRDDCEAGAMCWDVDTATGEGTCVSFCPPPDAARACPGTTECMLDGHDVLALCLPTCDPLASRCGAGQTCRYFPASRNAFCLPDDGGQVQASTVLCGSEDEACGAERVCISAGSFGGCGAPSCCTRWCDHTEPTADLDCEAEVAGHVCRPLFEDETQPKALNHLGFCAVPPRSRNRPGNAVPGPE